MTDIAIRVEGLSKLYRIGPRERYKTLRDSLTDALYAPFHALATAVRRPSSVLGLPSSVPGRLAVVLWSVVSSQWSRPQSPVLRLRSSFTGGGHRLSSRVDRAREHLPEWRDSWDEKSGNGAQVR